MQVNACNLSQNFSVVCSTKMHLDHMVLRVGTSALG